jgi:predicted  nucleic acid-binding Zn-ribbon protein
MDCLNSAGAYLKSQKDSVLLTTNLTAQIPVIDLGITTEMANKAETQKKVDDTNLRLSAAKVKLAAAVTDADKKAYTSAVSAWTSAVRLYTSQLNKITLNIRKLESAKLAATNQPAQLKADVANTKANAQLICTKGF